ncbi:MAG: ABC transporter permease [Desulfosporosinus sp.]|jgi:ABC-2 type transport system permease protein
MTTLISAEWYKLIRSKVLAVILGGVTVQTLIQVLAEYINREASPVPGQFGVTVPADTSLFLQVWLVAFVGYFVASEFQNGTMRNTLALGKNRTHVYLSKLLSAFVAIAVIYATVSIVSTAGLSAVAGFGDMTLSEFSRFFFWNFSMQLLYHLTFAAMFIMFVFLSRSVGMSILLSIGYWIVKMFLPMVFGVLGLAFAVQFLPDYYISAFKGLSGDPTFITKGIVVSVAYIVIASIIGCIVFKKTDIK